MPLPLPLISADSRCDATWEPARFAYTDRNWAGAIAAARPAKGIIEGQHDLKLTISGAEPCPRGKNNKLTANAS